MTEDKEMTNENVGGERVVPVTGDASDAEALVEKADDFSSDAEPVEEETAPPQEGEAPEKRVAELEDRLLRTMAEFDNFRKRNARLTEDLIKSANDKLLLDLLEIADNFERALQHAPADDSGASVREGLTLIYNQLVALFARYGVTPIEAIGQKFDPEIHDAMMQVRTDEFAEGIVATEMLKGYRRGDQVLRHSKVGVSTGRKASE